MDIENINVNSSLKEQKKIKEEFESKLKKGPYHYFVKEKKDQYKSKKELNDVWKNIPFKDYLKYLKMAVKKTKPTKPILPKVEGYTVLTNRGYEIPKKMYPDKFLDKIRKNLTVKPKTAKGYGKEPDAYPIYKENKDTIFIPRYYGQTILDQDKIPNKLSKGLDINVTFNPERTLRDYQNTIIDRLTKKLKEKGGSILQIPCGFGKTCCALKMIAVLQKKTLVLLHAEHLLNQWKERIEEFLPGAKIGRIQGPVVDIEGKDVVIGMIQSVCKKDYKDSIFDQFGLVISDEAHRTGAKEFCKALRRSASFYTLGLTATPTRRDGLTKVFKWYLGDLLDISDLKSIFKKYKYDVTVQAIYYVSEHYEEKKLYTGGFNFANMMGQIVEEKRRNDIIVKMARDMVINDERQVLIISHRIAHIRMLAKMIESQNTLKEVVTTGFFIGGMKEEDLIKTTKQNVIIGSYKMIEEGADIKTLDSIILTTPKSDVEQATGRIMRQKNKNTPLIIDFIDMFSVFVNQSFKRMRYYKSKNYNLVGYKNVDNDSEKAEKITKKINFSNAFEEDSD